VITDLKMPKMDGGELIRRLKQMTPALKIACMSGIAEAIPEFPDTNGGSVTFLQKPFSSGTLLEILHRLLKS
jgi:FixJ family two-component response regulator